MFHYVLSIYNTREIQFGNKVSDEVCKVSKQKEEILKKTQKAKLPQPSITDPWSGGEENAKFLHLLVIYLEVRISCSGETLKSQTSAAQQTQ